MQQFKLRGLEEGNDKVSERIDQKKKRIGSHRAWRAEICRPATVAYDANVWILPKQKDSKRVCTP